MDSTVLIFARIYVALYSRFILNTEGGVHGFYFFCGASSVHIVKTFVGGFRKTGTTVFFCVDLLRCYYLISHLEGSNGIWTILIIQPYSMALIKGTVIYFFINREP